MEIKIIEIRQSKWKLYKLQWKWDIRQWKLDTAIDFKIG